MSLQDDLSALASNNPDHIIGVAVNDLRAAQTIAAVNADRHFQLASMFKVPLLVAALRRVESGALKLDTRYTLETRHKLIGSGVLSYLDDGLQPTLRDLLTLMIIYSDNTATDIVLDLIGGPADVEATLSDLGISDIHIRHTTRELLWAVFPSSELALTDAEIARAVQRDGLTRRDATIGPDAPTNTATPAALNMLLASIERGKAATSESTALMRTILKRQTYNQRLPLTWPEAIDFAHKTGTLGNMRGDCGIAYFPGRTLAISAIVQSRYTSLPLPPEVQRAGDALLAQIGASIWRWAGVQ